LNKLNQNFQPSEGSKSYFSQDLPIFSDDWSFANTYTFSKYLRLRKDSIFSINFLAKTVNSLTGEDVRVSKRIFIPSRRLRGFEYGKIGPIDSGDYIGGNYASSLSFNSTLPQLFPTLQDIDFSLFFDTANVWGVDYNSSLDSSKIRSSTGLSIDWFTPIGPLSFSFAKPITKASSDSTETFRFDIGTSF
jgi:outer membrane protein insertion porin family